MCFVPDFYTRNLCVFLAETIRKTQAVAKPIYNIGCNPKPSILTVLYTFGQAMGTVCIKLLHINNTLCIQTVYIHILDFREQATDHKSWRPSRCENYYYRLLYVLI